MGVNVNTFKTFVEFVSNKTQQGNAVTPTQFNLVANQAQLQLMEKDYETFLQTKNISNFLKTFLRNTVLNVPVNGELSYPSDFQHLSDLRKYYIQNGKGIEIPVEGVRDEAWGDMQRSQLFAPILEFPKYSEFSNVIRFLPKNVGIIMMDYFKTPVVPIWAYTIVNNEAVYNPSTSVNFEWDSFALNNIAAIYLSLIGCNLKDTELAQFSEMYKAQTNSTL